MSDPKIRVALFLTCSALFASGCVLLKDARKLARLSEDVADVATKTRSAANRADEQIDRWTEADERALGDGAALLLAYESGGLLDDWALTEYLNYVANAVGIHSSREPNQGGRGGSRRFVAGVLDTDEVNAFSTPGGWILVTRGLLDQLETEAELAYVLAHEIAHIDREHALAYVKTQALGKELAAAFIGSENAPVLENEKVYDELGDLVVQLVKTVKNQKRENEADDLAVDLMTRAGYNPKAALAVLEKLEKTSPDRKKTLGATHPPASERAQRLSGRVSGAGVHNFGRFDAAVKPFLARRTAKAP